MHRGDQCQFIIRQRLLASVLSTPIQVVELCLTQFNPNPNCDELSETDYAYSVRIRNLTTNLSRLEMFRLLSALSTPRKENQACKFLLAQKMPL